MTYRGEDEAQRARVAELERAIEAKDAEIAVLRGERPPTQPGTTVEHSGLSGGPTKYAREITLPYALSEEGYEAIAKVLRERLGLHATQVGRTLTVPRFFSLDRDGGGTQIRLSADWSAMPAAVVASTILVGGFGTITSAGILADVLAHGMGSHHGMTFDSIETAVVVGIATALTLGTGWLTRRRTSRNSRRLLADYEGTFAAIVALAEKHAVRDVPKTRVSASESESESDAVRRTSSTRRS